MINKKLHSSYPFEYVYHFLNEVQGIINEPIFEYFTDVPEKATDLIEEFLDSEENRAELLAKPFPKYSRLHSFCRHVFSERFYGDIYLTADMLRQSESEATFLNEVLEAYKIPHSTIQEWLSDKKEIDFDSLHYGQFSLTDVEGLVTEYYNFLWNKGALKKLDQIVVDEMFFILFMNRTLLRKFNQLLSEKLKEIKKITESTQELFSKNGTLKRKNIPKWVKRAIFFRDRGKCSFCLKDLSGLVNTANSENFDHIIPLALGGINDVTNIQLLCETCNKKKRHFNSDTSIIYEKWY